MSLPSTGNAPQESLKSVLNLPNKLSLARIAMIPLMVALLIPNTTVCCILAAVVFSAASVTDYLDGQIARKRHIETVFGKFIDPVADKLLVLSAMVMLIHCGLMPAWVVVVILARELAVDGLRLVAASSPDKKVIAAAWLGKVKTASQMVLILWLMILRAPVMTSQLYNGLTFPTAVSTLGTLWVVVITIWSGVSYFAKSGKLLLNSK